MNDALYRAIFAMDAYNRGYDQSVRILTSDSLAGQREQGRKLGNATIIQSDISDAARSAGFYGIAYSYGESKIISYRGTDRFVPDIIRGIGSDIDNGWPLGFGSTYSAQGSLAIDFYRSVAGPANDPYAAAISTVGHSLGGGLAGYVASNDNPSKWRRAA
jgi:hypothetical protein